MWGGVLWREANFGNLETTALLLEYGADANLPDEGGLTLLHTVPTVDVAELLLDHGADVNAAPNIANWTPLHGAVGRGNLGMIELLLDRGADIEAQDSNGTTPLKTAILAADPSVDVIELLLDRGAARFAEHYGRLTPCRTAQSEAIFADMPILDRLCAGAEERETP